MPHQTRLASPRRAGRMAALLLAVASLWTVAGCSHLGPPEGVGAVQAFELPRYEGRWYELARLDHRFERGMSNVSATYTRQPDGSVQVRNRGFEAASGRWREAIGRAQFLGSPETGSLKVSFFGPFYGGYHVAALAPDYSWSLVIGPDRSYCWILARSKTLDAAQRDAIVARAKALGIQTDALIWVAHDRQDPAYTD